MSTRWIARYVCASAVYSNLLILFKMESIYLGHLPSLILSYFVFKMLRVPKNLCNILTSITVVGTREEKCFF